MMCINTAWKTAETSLTSMEHCLLIGVSVIACKHLAKAGTYQTHKEPTSQGMQWLKTLPRPDMRSLSTKYHINPGQSDGLGFKLHSVMQSNLTAGPHGKNTFPGNDYSAEFIDL